MSKFRYIAINPDVLDSKELQESRALGLLAFLTDHQTDAEGRVNYGREFGYAWIRSRWLAAPSIRTMKRHMAALRKLGLVEVRRVFAAGMRVRILNSAKFANPVAPQAVQLPLFAGKVTPFRAVEKPVDNQWKSSDSPDFNRATDGPKVGPRMAPERLKK